jgi:hypothetical protein
VCRNAVRREGGGLDVEDVLEVVALDALPGDAGPLTFLAFLRGLPPGPGVGAFVLHPAGRPDHETARLPVRAQVPEAYADRQVALQVRLPSVPVSQGGWFEVVFEWAGRPLARNRFAIGVR